MHLPPNNCHRATPFIIVLPELSGPYNDRSAPSGSIQLTTRLVTTMLHLFLLPLARDRLKQRPHASLFQAQIKIRVEFNILFPPCRLSRHMSTSTNCGRAVVPGLHGWKTKCRDMKPTCTPPPGSNWPLQCA
jgi:hypothetical protein